MVTRGNPAGGPNYKPQWAIDADIRDAEARKRAARQSLRKTSMRVLDRPLVAAAYLLCMAGQAIGIGLAIFDLAAVHWDALVVALAPAGRGAAIFLGSFVSLILVLFIALRTERRLD